MKKTDKKNNNRDKNGTERDKINKLVRAWCLSRVESVLYILGHLRLEPLEVVNGELVTKCLTCTVTHNTLTDAYFHVTRSHTYVLSQ